MRKLFKLIAVLFLTLFLLSCNTNKENYEDEKKEYDVKEDVTISDITYNSFIFHLDARKNIDIESIELYKDSEFVKTINDGVVDNLDGDTEYRVIIKYKYDDGQEKSEEIISVKTIPLPEYTKEVLDDLVRFYFGAFPTVTTISLGDKRYERDGYELVIDNLEPNTSYDYLVYYIYEGKEYNVSSSFTTLDKGYFNVEFYDPRTRQSVVVSYKSGETVVMPDLRICHNGYAYDMDKYYVFDGFDADLASINDDMQVNILYSIKEPNEIISLCDLYKWLTSIDCNDIEKVKVGYYEEQEFAPSVSSEVELNKEDEVTIEELIRRLKEEEITTIDDNKDKTGDGRYYFIISFFTNEFEFVISFPRGKYFVDGRMVSTELCNYLLSLIED